MALQKQIERAENQVRGLFAEGYHRIAEVTLDRNHGRVRVRVFAYADADARHYEANEQMHTGQQRLAESWAEFPIPETTPDDIIAWAYAAIKSDPRYADASDC